MIARRPTPAAVGPGGPVRPRAQPEISLRRMTDRPPLASVVHVRNSLTVRAVTMASAPARFLFRRPLPYVDPGARRGPVTGALVDAGSSAMSRRLSTTRLWRQTVWKIEPYL